MKKILTVITLLAACVSQLDAQTYMVNALVPTESKKCSIYKTGGSAMKICCYDITGGFALGAPSGGLISDNVPGKAVFALKGAYSKLTFVMGPYSNGNPDKGNSIVTVSADGKRLLDEVVFAYDAPRFLTFDVAGVNEIVFTIPRGDTQIAFGNVKLWKAGTAVSNPNTLLSRVPGGTVDLMQTNQLYRYRESGFVKPVLGDKAKGTGQEKAISINRKEYNSGLSFSVSQALAGTEQGFAYFWLDKRYDKVSFVVGPRDNQSSNSSAWLVVKADKKTVYEGMVTQKDLAKQIVVDVKGASRLGLICEYRNSDFLGGITYGVVDIKAYPEGASVPAAGIVNPNRDRIAKLPDVCPLMSSIKPYSVRGISSADKTLFTGESRHYTFSMGGEKYWEGLLLTTGNKLLGDRVASYAEFDLAGEYDWISFDAGCLSMNHVLDDDNLRVYADDKLIFDHTIYCTWPNQHYELPVNKCRTLRFEKLGNGKNKQTIIGVGDIILYRGRPVPNTVFEHDVPDCPHDADLIDVCGKPYFHYVGRYVSDLTNFNMADCFHDGSTITKYFQMKDGRQINKGFMLESNIPLGLENVTVMDAVFMALTGVGSTISSSNVSAATGISAGVSGTPTASIFLLLEDKNSKQASAAAFNPYGQYESCTFTVANRVEYVDAFDDVFQNKSPEALLNPVKLNVFADQVLVGEYWLDNKMQPLTVTVPIFKCHQLMFWLECGDKRSGQYVFYDLKLSKTPCNIPIPKEYTSSQAAKKSEAQSAKQTVAQEPAPERATVVQDRKPAKKDKKDKKAKSRIDWEVRAYQSSSSAVNEFLRDVNAMWEKTAQYMKGNYDFPSASQTWVQSKDGTVYKCLSFIGSNGNRLSISSMIKTLQDRIAQGKDIQFSISLAKTGVASASLGVTSVTSIEDMVYFGKKVKEGSKALAQCNDDISDCVALAQAQIDAFNAYRSSSVSADGKTSSDTVLILRPEPGDTVPGNLQQLEYYNF